MSKERNSLRPVWAPRPSIVYFAATWAGASEIAKSKTRVATTMARILASISIASLALLSACATRNTDSHSQEQDYDVETFLREPISLGINGFNYTDVVIDSFSVNSVWGGNIFVSTPTSGGGGTTCCYSLLTLSSRPILINIKWMRYINEKQYWCRTTVTHSGPIPQNPTDLNVHFMPDGRIEIDITNGHGNLKMHLPRFSTAYRNSSQNVIHNPEKAVCSDAR